MECKTCGRGHGLMLLKEHYIQIGNDNVLPNMITLVPETCDCCGGYWEDCTNCTEGRRVINWVDPGEWQGYMDIWLNENIHQIIVTDEWISFAEYTQEETVEDFMRYLQKMLQHNTERVGDTYLEDVIPGNPKKDVVVLARRSRLALVQIQYNRGHMGLQLAKQYLRGNLSPKNPETFYDDSELLIVKEEDKGTQDENEQ